MRNSARRGGRACRSDGGGERRGLERSGKRRERCAEHVVSGAAGRRQLAGRLPAGRAMHRTGGAIGLPHRADAAGRRYVPTLQVRRQLRHGRRSHGPDRPAQADGLCQQPGGGEQSDVRAQGLHYSSLARRMGPLAAGLKRRPSHAPGTGRFDSARGDVVYYWEVFHDVSRPDVHDLLLLSRGPEGPPCRRSSSVLVSRPLIDPHSNRRPEAREAQAFRAFFVPGR